MTSLRPKGLAKKVFHSVMSQEGNEFSQKSSMKSKKQAIRPGVKEKNETSRRSSRQEIDQEYD